MTRDGKRDRPLLCLFLLHDLSLTYVLLLFPAQLEILHPRPLSVLTRISFRTALSQSLLKPPDHDAVVRCDDPFFFVWLLLEGVSRVSRGCKKQRPRIPSPQKGIVEDIGGGLEISPFLMFKMQPTDAPPLSLPPENTNENLWRQWRRHHQHHHRRRPSGDASHSSSASWCSYNGLSLRLC